MSGPDIQPALSFFLNQTTSNSFTNTICVLAGILTTQECSRLMKSNKNSTMLCCEVTSHMFLQQYISDSCNRANYKAYHSNVLIKTQKKITIKGHKIPVKYTIYVTNSLLKDKNTTLDYTCSILVHSSPF